jgi:pimeloyl-ACP methyl ester carboxylesterase
MKSTSSGAAVTDASRPTDPSDPNPPARRRRRIFGVVVALASLLALAGWVPPGVARADDRGSRPEALGQLAGSPPDLPPGFGDVFKDRFIQVGKVRLHAVTGGDGPPLLLVHGWPETWYSWRLVMPALARHFSVVAVDQRGVGLSDKPQDGYDSATLASDLVGLMHALGHDRFSIYGTDTGMPIAYAVAADYRDRVDRLAVSEAFLPGIAGGASSAPLLLPPPYNARLWHLAFNQLPPEVTEALVRGREDVFFGVEFDASAGTIKLPDEVVRYYVRILRRDPSALRGSFGFYRALWTTAEQNVERAKVPLTIPVLAMASEQSGGGDSIGVIMRSVATNVQTLTINGAGHWVAEQAPDQIVATLTTFLPQS